MTSIEPLEPLRLTRRDYYRLGEAGAFAGRRVQLVGGTIITMSPMGSPHATLITRLTGLLALELVPLGLDVRVQLPLALAEDSEPEPDVAVLPTGSWGPDHPSTALLVIEVADSSRRLDLGPKALLYAAARIPEYWVLDAQRRVATIHTAPRRGRYAIVRSVAPTGTISSAALPSLAAHLRELWPARRRSARR